jgi:YidC/Oxa1 family membrane protein insertase
MDDKRTLLAFLLVGLIFLLMPYYYELMGLSPPPLEEQVAREEVSEAGAPAQLGEPEKTRVEATPTQAVTERDVTGTTDVVDSPITPSASRTVVMGSSVHRLEFSTRGGVLVSAQLLDYRRPDGRQVDLIPSGGQALRVSLRSETSERVIDLGDLHFEPSADSVWATDGGEG